MLLSLTACDKDNDDAPNLPEGIDFAKVADGSIWESDKPEDWRWVLPDGEELPYIGNELMGGGTVYGYQIDGDTFYQFIDNQGAAAPFLRRTYSSYEYDADSAVVTLSAFESFEIESVNDNTLVIRCMDYNMLDDAGAVIEGSYLRKFFTKVPAEQMAEWYENFPLIKH